VFFLPGTINTIAVVSDVYSRSPFVIDLLGPWFAATFNFPKKVQKLPYMKNISLTLTCH
jgi:hypothetical protein